MYKRQGQNGNPGTGVWYFDDITLYHEGGENTTASTEQSVETTTTEATTTTVGTDETTDTEATTASDVQTTEAQQTTTATTTEVVIVPGDVLYGDVNTDGRVELVDAILLNKYCAGTVTLSEEARANADCNASGMADTGDSIVLLRFLVHLVSALPCAE